MKTLVIADVHEQVVRLSGILKRESDYSKAVFTGDYFDSKCAEVAGVEKSLQMVLDLIEDSRNVLLMGNHDAHYIFPNNPYIACSVKSARYMQTIGAQIHVLKKHLKFYHYDTTLKVLFSHAGITDKLYEKAFSDLSIDDKLKFLDSTLATATEQLITRDNPDVLVSVGYERGGMNRHGGLFWGDLRKHFVVPGLKQIFGHTQVGEPVAITLKRDVFPLISTPNYKPEDSYSIGNDTGLDTYLSIENGIATIKDSDSGEVRGQFQI